MLHDHAKAAAIEQAADTLVKGIGKVRYAARSKVASDSLTPVLAKSLVWSVRQAATNRINQVYRATLRRIGRCKTLS